MKNSIYLIPFLFLSCATKRNVDKNLDVQKKDSVAIIKEQTYSIDSTKAKISKIKNNMAFDLEPINGSEAKFVYIVGKDTIKVITTGKLKVKNSNEKVEENIKTLSDKKEIKDNSIKVKSFEKKKTAKIQKENSSFQFVLIGMFIVIALQLLWKQIKEKYFI